MALALRHCVACALAGAWALAGAGAHASQLDAVQQQLVRLSASMNELALACGRYSASTVENARADMREALRSQGVEHEAYEAAYAAAQRVFWQQWHQGTPAQQASSCAHMQWQGALQGAGEGEGEAGAPAAQ